MRNSPHRYRFLVAIALFLCAPTLAFVVSCNPTGDAKTTENQSNLDDAVAVPVAPRPALRVRLEEGAAGTAAWPTFFGSSSRNPVNSVEKNIATGWSIEEGAAKNIKWVQTCGSRSYAGPVFAGGRIFVGTNNENPRDPKITGDKGILLCLDEKTG